MINGRYKIVGILGKGGYGEVYKVEDLYENNRVLALKKIRAKALNETNIDTFKVEFKFLTSLSHPNLVKVYDFDIDREKKELFFTMEYICGKSLFVVLGKETSYDKIYNYIVQSCRALSYIHSRGIIHCDIKPDNMLVDENGILKLMDFGFAGYKKDSRVRGTIQFMAPDFILKKKISRKIDFYSLGASLYYCIARELPFKGKNKNDLLKNTLKGKFKPLDQVKPNSPDALIRLIHKAMTKNPENRFGNGDEIIKFINKNTDYNYDYFTKEEVRSYFTPGKLFGRKTIFTILQEMALQVFSRKNYYENIPVMLLSEEGTGKSSIFREFKYLIQLKEDLDYFDANFVIRDEKPFQAFEVIIEEMIRLYNLTPSDIEEISFLSNKEIEDDLNGSEYIVNSQYIKQLQAKHICNFFIKISRSHKFVLELRNFEKANSASLLLFKQIAETIKNNPEKDINFLLLTSTQLEDLPKYHKVFINILKKDIRLLKLTNLNYAQTVEYVHDLLLVRQFPETISNIIFLTTKGNPLKINEFFIYIFFNKYLRRKNGHWKLKEDFCESLPKDLDSLASENFSKISNLQKIILKEMLIIQRPTYQTLFDIVKQLAGVSNEKIQTALDILYSFKIIGKIKYSQGFHYYIPHKHITTIIKSHFTTNEFKDWNLLTGNYIKDTNGISQDTAYSLSDYYYRSKNKEKTTEVLKIAINKSFQDNDLELAVYNLKRLYKFEKDPERKTNVLLASLNTLFFLSQYKSILDGIKIFIKTQQLKIESSTLIDFNILQYNAAEKVGDSKALESSSSWLINHMKEHKLSKNSKSKVYHWVGQYYRKKFLLDKSYKYLKKAISINKSLKLVFISAQVQFDLVLTLFEDGKFEKALNKIFEVIEVYEEHEDKRSLINCFYTIGNIYFELWNLELAKQFYHKAKVISNELNNTEFEYKISLKTAKVFILELNLQDSKSILDTFSKITKSINNLEIISEYNFISALYWFVKGDIQQAIDFIKRAIQTNFNLKNYPKGIVLLLTLAVCYLLQDKNDTAFKICIWCEKKSKKSNSRLNGYSNIVKIMYFLREKDFYQAKKSLKNILKQLNKKNPVANIYYYILKASIYFQNNEYSESLDTMQYFNIIADQNSTIFEENKIVKIATELIKQRINCYNGLHESGIKQFSSIIKHLDHSDADLVKAYANYYLGIIYNDLNNKFGMESCLKVSSEIFEKISPNNKESILSKQYLQDNKCKK